MPRATSNLNETHELTMKTIKGGFVKARRLTYGEKLQRRAMVSSLKVQAEKGKKDFAGEMQLVTEESSLFDFQKCILEHNLTKPNPESPDDETVDLPLIFGSTADIRSLDPRAGEEIDTFLSELNNFEEDEEN